MIAKSFEFNTVKNILFEWDGSSKLGELISSKYSIKSLLLVTDDGLSKLGLIEPIKHSLSSKGIQVHVFDKVMSDPTDSIVLECAAFAKNIDIDAVIGVGGGSSLDVAKVVSFLNINPSQELSSMYGINNIIGNRLPLILVPTTSGTGSEVTNISILTTGEHTKMGIVSPVLYCDLVLLDAKLTCGLPAFQTAATGIDAMVHAIEAYTSKHKKNPISDTLARKALKLLSDNLVTACNESNNREAREGMLLGATLAGQAFSNSPVAAVHALAYPLGGFFHISHGLSNALMLEPVLNFNAKVAAPLYAELGEVLGVAKNQNDQKNTDAFINKIIELVDDSNITRRLRDAGVPEDSLFMLAKESMNQTRLLVNNPVEVTESDALMLYQQAY